MKNKIQFVIFFILTVFCITSNGCSRNNSSAGVSDVTLSLEQIENLINFGVFSGKDDIDKLNLANDDKLVLTLIVKYNEDGLTSELEKQLKDATENMKNLELRKKLLLLLSEL
jgi:hypothetical protein